MSARSPILRALLGVSLIASLAALPGAARAAAADPARQSTPVLIEQARQSGEIDKKTANLYRAYALGRPEELPSEYRSDTPWEGTVVLLHLQEAAEKMNDEATQREILDIIEPLGGGNCSSSSGAMSNQVQSTYFFVEYNSIAAGSGLTITDYLDSLDGAWETHVNDFGWAAPPVRASNPPPGNKYHVRIDSLGPGLYGFVSSSGAHAGFVGDNPATTWNDVDAHASCMVLNRNYANFPSPPQASLDSTTAHEFNHSVQNAYGALQGTNRPDDAFVEGGATWMEDEVYDTANDNYNYLWPAFSDSLGDYDASPYPYWIAFRGFTERYGAGTAGGGEQVMQDFWEETSKNTGDNLTAMQTALSNRGTTLADAFHAYAIAVKFNRSCSGSYVYPYCFEEGPAYVSAAGATAVHRTISSVGGSATGSIEDNYALHWVSVPVSGGAFSLTLANTSAGGQLRGSVVCDTGSTLLVNPFPAAVGSGGSTTLASFNPAGCLSAVAVLTNQSQTAPNPTSSTARSYSVTTAAVAVECPGFAGDPRNDVVGTPGPDTLTGTSSADIICGMDGADTISGLGGNDLLIGGNHDDIMAGGSGDDEFRGEAGNDAADFAASATGVTVDVSTPTGSATGEGTDTLISVEYVRGSAANDSITGGAEANIFIGIGGADVMDGGGGADTTYGGPGGDSLTGGAGMDILNGGGGGDSIFANDGEADTVNGGAGTDTAQTDNLDTVTNVP